MAIIRSEKLPVKFTVTHLSWSAVIAGTVVGLMVQVTLLFLGTAIGLYSINVSEGLSQFGGLGTGASIWWLISALISLFAGGWLASRFAGIQRIFDGILHGVVTWSVITVLTLTVLTNVVGGIVGGTFRVVGSVFSTTGRFAGSVLGSGAGQDAVTGVVDQAQQIISQVRAKGGENAVNELTQAIGDVFRDPTVTPVEKQRISGLLVRYADMSWAEADNRVDQWSSAYNEALAQANRLGNQVLGAGEDVANALGTAALWAFITLLLGGGAAAYGGFLGRVRGRVKV